MSEIRVIPILTVKNEGLYRTLKFKKPSYVGDPINSVRIFNDKEVDELILLDISGGDWNDLDFSKFVNIANYAFMPLAYGGRIKNIEHVKKAFKAGFEKVVINSAAHEDYDFIRKIANIYGSQSVIVSIDVKSSLFSKKLNVYVNNGQKKLKISYLEAAISAEEAGAGELIVRSIDKDGLMEGYDASIIKEISSAVSIPVVAAGGAGSIDDLKVAVDNGAHSVSAGSMFVYQGPHRAVLINYPKRSELEKFELLYRKN